VFRHSLRTISLTEPAKQKASRPAVETFPVLGKAPAAVQPRELRLDNPAFWKHQEAFYGVSAFDDLDVELIDKPLTAAWNFHHDSLHQRRVCRGTGTT
jgi:hypothetical protein